MAREKKGKGKSARGSAKGPVAEIGVIGGSGLYGMNGLTDAREIRVKTPFGDPSDAIVVGTLEGKRVAFLARHGRGHRLLPSEVNFRANIYAMKLLAWSASSPSAPWDRCRKNCAPASFWFPTSFLTAPRAAPPRSSEMGWWRMSRLTSLPARNCPWCWPMPAFLPAWRFIAGAPTCMEGPQFSTLAEANFHRAMKFEVIGMTNVTEAKLAREAELCYATIAMITDYDCWHPQHDSVTVAQIIATLNQNASNAQNVLREAIKTMPAARSCKCGSALAHAMLTDPKVIPAKTKKNLAALIGRYIS